MISSLALDGWDTEEVHSSIRDESLMQNFMITQIYRLIYVFVIYCSV